jgi:hypothetical protein
VDNGLRKKRACKMVRHVLLVLLLAAIAAPASAERATTNAKTATITSTMDRASQMLP